MIKNSTKNKPIIVSRPNPLTKGQFSTKNNNFIMDQTSSQTIMTPKETQSQNISPAKESQPSRYNDVFDIKRSVPQV
jgi:hypothetical protein